MIKPLSDKEHATKQIIEKINYVLGGINTYSTRQADNMAAQTVCYLSEAYKNLTVEEDNNG